MADKENPRNERDLKPELFPGDAVILGGKVKDDGLPGKFTTPEPTDEQRKQKFNSTEIAVGKTIQWLRFIDNAEILESSEREKVKAYLDELLDGLQRRYGPGSTEFPSTAELSQLTAVVTKLGSLIGVTKSDFGDLLSAMKRIENRWSKTLLVEFADQLRNQLLKVPLSPLSVVHQALLKCPAPEKNRRQILREVKLVLIGKANHDAKEFPWEKAFSAIEGLVFADGKLSETDLTPSDPITDKQRRRLGYLALMDLRRQQLEWEKKYLARITPSFNWLYLLQRQTDYELLAQVYCSDFWSPGEVKDWLEQDDNRARRRKSYHKPKPKRRQKVLVVTPRNSSQKRQK